ncbi:DUF4400 domain-containing protein [Neiella marina]|uniref:DUF4400 domain-containing protein n=1 Tax=Neiella holothuriorum TaxID=2870530 RepID=A0ABS7EHK6_9GAMM|nr:DUF4400 domain-containing protein [Neiella holothuriorum]MBW8191378.1 DUF4400 domain-containing protein [Neiella holothuriorum]
MTDSNTDSNQSSAPDLSPAQQTAKGVFIAMLSFFSLVYLMVGITTERYESLVTNEVVQARSIMHESDWHEVTGRAAQWYTIMAYEWGVVDFLDRAFVPKSEHGVAVKMLKLKTHLRELGLRMTNNVKLIMYQGAFRVSSFGLWVMVCSPLVLAAAYDGYNKWRIKAHSFGGITVRRFHLWLKMLGVSMLILLAFFLVPGFLGTYAVYYPPILLFIMALIANRMLSTYQKRL